METCELEEQIYKTLKNDEELMGLLAEGESSIFHLQAPEVYPALPILVYTPISDVPLKHGDNVEKLHRVTIRIHIITGKEDYQSLYMAVKRIMADLEFTRVQTTPFIEDGDKILIVDFKKIIGG